MTRVPVLGRRTENATELGMIRSAMEILGRRRIDAYRLVFLGSSTGEFASLRA